MLFTDSHERLPYTYPDDYSIYQSNFRIYDHVFYLSIFDFSENRLVSFFSLLDFPVAKKDNYDKLYKNSFKNITLILS